MSTCTFCLLYYLFMDFDVVFVQLLSPVQLFATPQTAACQASLSFTISQSLLKLTSIESIMPSNYLILFPPSVPCGTQDSSSPTRDHTCFPRIGSVVSQPLVHQGSPMEVFSFLIYLLIGGKLHYNTLLASVAPMGVLNLLACHLLASMLQGNFTVYSLSHLISVFVLAYQILLILPVSFWTFSSFTLSLHVLLHIWMGPYGKIIMSPKP